MRQRSGSPVSSTSSSQGRSSHIVVFDDEEQGCPPGDSSKLKRRSPTVRFAGKITRLVLATLCVNGVLLFHNGWRKKISGLFARLAAENTSDFVKSVSVSVHDVSGRIAQEMDMTAPLVEPETHIQLPNVLVIGAPNSGTTNVGSWLFHHDIVCRPKDDKNAFIKEVHYFDSENYDELDVALYEKHFAGCEKKSFFVDATSDYLKHADRIRETYEKVGGNQAANLKVIVVLREQVDLEFSWYNKMVADLKRKIPPKYTKLVKNKKGQIVSFDKYAKTMILPHVETSHAWYSSGVRNWMKYFDRRQLLVMSYDELAKDPESASDRLQKFLHLNDPKLGSPTDLLKVEQPKTAPLCTTQKQLADAFAPSNKDLYEILEEPAGPEVENKPFPKFQLGSCVSTTKSTKAADAAKKSVKKQSSSKAASKIKHRIPPKTVFFATHHKTGTDLSRSVATVLSDQGLAYYTGEPLDEANLFKDESGNKLKCAGSSKKPEIRSYHQWSKWVIESLWGKCVGDWWNQWPSVDRTTKDLFENCIMGHMDELKKQLKEVSCGDDYLIVHFVRNPIDLMLSSYRYTQLGKEDWMKENIVGHRRFKGEYCGKHECQDMTVQEAVRDLPVDVGMLLEMRLVSMEIVKQMMVASVLARGDPKHHITVNLSDIMESTEKFDKWWTKILRGVLPTKSNERISNLVKMLKQFDMNHDPENFAGKSHSTVGKTSEAKTKEHKENLLSDKEVKVMLGDPLVKTLL